MKEVLYKKEFVKHSTVFYELSSPIDDNGKYVDSAQVFLPPTKKHPLFHYVRESKDEKDFEENFQNQMTLVHRKNFLVVIEKNGDKIALKAFESVTIRKSGVSWFKKVKHMSFITVNTKTGDIYDGGIQNYQLKRKCKKVIRKNYFAGDMLPQWWNDIRYKIKEYVYGQGHFEEEIASEIIDEFINLIDPQENFVDLTPSERLFKFYLDKKGYRYPNNFGVYIKSWFGPDLKKCLKKCDNKMIDGIMMLFNLSGKKIKKTLHTCNFFNHGLYDVALDLFGEDWLNQDEELLRSIFNSTTMMARAPEVFKEHVSQEELKRVLSLFKQVFQYGNLNSNSLYDHIRMYCELKQFGEDIKWLSSSDSKNTFREEHLDWTEKLDHYRRGSYTRIYPEFSYELINEPFEMGGLMYRPVLLDSSDNYNEESSSQSNCVKGYVGKCSSIIVSLRRGEGDEMERATLEYSLTYKTELKRVRIERIQSLGRFNGVLDSSWNQALFKLDERMLYYVKDEKFDTVKIKKKCSNSVELMSPSYWTDNGHLRWDKETISQNTNYYYNNEFFE